VKARLLEAKAINLQNDIDELYDKIKKKRKKLSKLKAKTEVVCSKCKTAHEIKDLLYIKTHWYTEPSGCTGGDYWTEGEGQTTCPACNVRIRFLCLDRTSDHKTIEHPFRRMQSEFKEVVDNYDKQTTKFVNLIYHATDEEKSKK
jgi:uncharacterized Zn finger protein (UPF0148 family)